MNRRDFVAASAIAILSAARTRSQDKEIERREEKPREPDILLNDYSGCVAFSPDSKILAVANGPVGDKQGICFVDPNTGKRLQDFEQTTDIKTRRGYGWPAVLAFSPNGQYFAAGGEGCIAIWDATSGRRLQDLELPSKDSRAAFGTVTTMSFSPDSTFIFAGRHFWPIMRSEEPMKLPGLINADGVAFSPDGKHFATRFEGVITIWAYPSLRKEKAFGRQIPSGGTLLFTPDGAHIVSERVYINQRRYYYWDIANGEPHYVPFEDALGYLKDLTSDGKSLVAATSRGVAIVSVGTGQTTALLGLESDMPARRVNLDFIVDLKFSPHDALVVCSRRSGIRIWKEQNGLKF